MNNVYIVKKNIDKIRHGGYTYFLNPNIYKEITYKLKQDEYLVYYTYPDSDKVILYSGKTPIIRLFEIECFFPLTHSEILGSLFGLNISDEVFGDIIIYGDKYYFYAMDEIGDFILDNLRMIGNKSVKIKECDIHTLDGYKRNFEKIEMIVSSLRIDTVIARIVGTCRDKVKYKIRNKEVILNYDVLSNNSYILKDNDIFSIRRFGKYKFMGIVKITKKNNYIIKINKYL